MKTNIVYFSVVICLFFINKPLKSEWVYAGLDTYYVNTFLVKGNKLFAGTAGDGFFLSTDNGVTWTVKNEGVYDYGFYVNVLVTNDYYIFAGTDNGVYMSFNDGDTWNLKTNGMGKDQSITSIVIKSGGQIFAGTSSGFMYVTTNYGTEWSKGYPLVYSSGIYALIVKDNNIFAGTGGEGIFYTSNSGANWIESSSGLTDPNVYHLLLNGNDMYAGTSSGVYISTNSGSNWNHRINGLTTLAVTGFDIKNNNLYVGTYGGGAFFSTDSGSNWYGKSDGLVYYYVNTLITDNVYIYAGILSDGVWRRPLSEMTAIVNASDEISGEYKLYQNYPNPFNPSTIIKFDLKTSANVELKVYDVMGKEVLELLNKELKVGTYEVEFSGKNLSSGMYYYKIKSGDFVHTKKMLLIK